MSHDLYDSAIIEFDKILKNIKENYNNQLTCNVYL